jgi:hypothetical protein
MTKPPSTIIGYEIGIVLDALTEHPLYIPGTLTERHLKRQLLIDNFLSYTINSFQMVYVAGYNVQQNTLPELRWFELNTQARSWLYQILALPNESAGSFVHLFRQDRRMWLTYSRK